MAFAALLIRFEYLSALNRASGKLSVTRFVDDLWGEIGFRMVSWFLK